jgi:hypothetical protein
MMAAENGSDENENQQGPSVKKKHSANRDVELDQVEADLNSRLGHHIDNSSEWCINVMYEALYILFLISHR